MKYSLLTIMLLGFGCWAPFTCSKVKATKEAAQKVESPKMMSKQMALYGPTVKVVTQHKA